MLDQVNTAITDRPNLANELRLAEERARHLAEFDVLTDLPNRAMLLRRLDQVIQSARDLQERVAVLYIDLDRFNNVNDSMGCDAGDRLLQVVAWRIRALVRHADIVARVSADEFVVVLPELRHPTDAAGVAHVLLESIRKPVELHDLQVCVTASIGISLFPMNGSTGEELVRNAVAAMYVAKDAGTGGYEFYAPSINAAATRKLQLESELRHALEHEELVLHYQPQVDLRTGQVTGAEALVRWNRPGVGLIPPGEFLPLAEERGLMLPLGRWVLTEAIRQMRAWMTLGVELPRIAVNVTAAELHREGFAVELATLLVAHNVPASRIEFELTEWAAVRDFESTRACLNALHAMGSSLSLDDFGTGYSSLSYLHRLPVDRVKIDQGFIRGLAPDSESIRIVRAIIGLARSFSLRVIAEGVENGRQVSLLSAEGCDEMQGFVTCPALPALQFQRFLQSWHDDRRTVTPAMTARRTASM